MMTRNIFSVILFIFTLSLSFAENIEIIEETNIEETDSDSTSYLDDEAEVLIKESDQDIEVAEESLETDLYKDESLLKTIEVIEEKNIAISSVKKFEDDIFLFMQGFGEVEFKWTIGLEFF